MTAVTPEKLTEAVARARAWFDALSPEEQAAHMKAQKEGYVRAEMSWGDEGTRVMSPAPSPVTDEVVAGLEKVRDHFDMLRELAAAGVVYEVDRATGKRTRRKLSEVVASECDEGSKFARSLLAKLEVRG